MARSPLHRYADPLDQIWLDAAARVGLRVVRSHDVYASTDGRGTLAIGATRDLDADDCLAQMIFHELCHSLIEGHAGLERPDWGLDNETERDVPREHACLRLQAALAAPLGLRRFLAPTTDFRAFYDELPEDPLAPAEAPSSVLARAGLARVGHNPWGPAVGDALAATAAIAHAAAAFAAPPSLYATVEPRWPRHAAGFPMPPFVADRRCADCAWLFRGGRGRAVSRCRQADGARIAPTDPACERFEPAVDCLSCGACCREAYGSVTISPRERLVARHPELVVRRDGYIEVRRDGERCAALQGGDGEPFLCAVYDDRPRPCRELEAGGEHCLTARRRVGLSR
jgi:hypothetical protein